MKIIPVKFIIILSLICILIFPICFYLIGFLVFYLLTLGNSIVPFHFVFILMGFGILFEFFALITPEFFKLIIKNGVISNNIMDGTNNDGWCESISNIRKIYPAYDLEGKKPRNKWVDTLHFAKIEGGKVANIISDYCEALCDFRLVETSSVDGLVKNLKKCMVKGVDFEIVSSSTPVVMSEKNPQILEYKKLAEKILNKKIKFEYEGGATDAREFAVRGSTVIMHSGSGDGMHASDEYVEIESVEKLSDIQIAFLEKLALAKAK